MFMTNAGSTFLGLHDIVGRQELNYVQETLSQQTIIFSVFSMQPNKPHPLEEYS